MPVQGSTVPVLLINIVCINVASCSRTQAADKEDCNIVLMCGMGGAQDHYNAVKAKLIPAVQKLKSGDPKSEEVFVGPLISEKEAKRIEEWIQEAVSRGAPSSGFAPPATSRFDPCRTYCKSDSQISRILSKNFEQCFLLDSLTLLRRSFHCCTAHPSTADPCAWLPAANPT